MPEMFTPGTVLAFLDTLATAGPAFCRSRLVLRPYWFACRQRQYDDSAPVPETRAFTPEGDSRPAMAKKRRGADLIAAIQRSPYRELEIEPERYRMPVRDVTL
jgi:hypothetical protein